MAMRQRAILPVDKQERRDAILDAAERVLSLSTERGASMAEVADEAKLAKGTVYLYFSSKEELLLALHERNIDAFFTPLIAMVEAREAVDFDRVFALTRRTMIEPPLFLPLAGRCFALMDQNLPNDVALAFRARMAERLQRAGAGLERHFAQMRAGDGLALLRHSYALILGLWQMAGGNATCSGGASVGRGDPGHDWQYAPELERALRALWTGSFRRNFVHSVP